jgi:hypothetical protein
MKQIAAVVLGVLLGIFVFTSVGCEKHHDPIVTLAEYNELTYGMTYDQVVAIVGSEPTNQGSVTAGTNAASVVVYEWVNHDDSKMVCTFENLILILKAQVNLK